MIKDLIVDLTRAKAIFQQRAILSAMGITQRDLVEPQVEQCSVCGDHHELWKIPHQCETGDGI